MSNETKPEKDANNDSNTRILDQARLRPQLNGWRPSNGKVINALIELKSSGLLDKTIKHIFCSFRFLANYCKGIIPRNSVCGPYWGALQKPTADGKNSLQNYKSFQIDGVRAKKTQSRYQMN